MVRVTVQLMPTVYTERAVYFSNCIFFLFNKRDSIKMHFIRNHLHAHGRQFVGVLKYMYCCSYATFWGETTKNLLFFSEKKFF